MKIPGVFYQAQTIRDVPAGTVIFEEGSLGTEMFGIVAGEVEFRRSTGAVRTLGPEAESALQRETDERWAAIERGTP